MARQRLHPWAVPASGRARVVMVADCRMNTLGRPPRTSLSAYQEGAGATPWASKRTGQATSGRAQGRPG